MERRRRQWREAARRYKTRHREKVLAAKRLAHKKYTYGLSHEEFVTILETQNGKCAGCKKPMQRKCVDHCHTTGAIRGILCVHCNFALGHVSDDPMTLRTLAGYLEKHVRLPSKVTKKPTRAGKPPWTSTTPRRRRAPRS